MLKLTDSANFSRTLAAIALILGPLLLALSALLDPVWTESPAQYLAAVRENTGAYLLAGAMSTIGTLLFAVGMLGVMRLLRRREISVGQVAAGVLILGLIGLAPTFAFNAIDVVLADAGDRSTAVAISAAGVESFGVNLYYMLSYFGGIVLGSFLLAFALLRRGIVPIWSPILLLVSIAVGLFGNAALLSALSFVLLTAAVAPLAMRMWGLSDEHWRRWELALDSETATAEPRDPSPPSGDPTPAT